MPYHRADAPASIPDAETIESLFGERNRFGVHKRRIPKLDELSDEARQKIGIVRLGKRTTAINGDPYGLLPCWAGNVGHAVDPRMESVMRSIFGSLNEKCERSSRELEGIAFFFSRITDPDFDPKTLADEVSEDGRVTIETETDSELVLRFTIGNKTIRLMQLFDLDKSDPHSIHNSTRAKESSKRAEELLGEGAMPVFTQKYLTAMALKQSKTQIPTRKTPRKQFFKELRASARERYWMKMSREERYEARRISFEGDDQLNAYLRIVQDEWQQNWTNNSQDPDPFRTYLLDQGAGQSAWRLLTEDVVVIIDSKRQILFANFEEVTQIMYDSETLELLNRCLDMWSFYVPLPAPETSRHVVDNYIRRLHPELDMEKATVSSLSNAKMAVAHYGCWARPGDPHGESLYSSATAAFAKSLDLDQADRLYPELYKAAFGKATRIFQLLIRTLAPGYYDEAREVWDNLGDFYKRRSTEEDFITLFVLGINGYTQRHRDIRDVEGGVAGLLSLGNYTGGNLCLPDLGVKVPYRPGTAAIVAGDVLEHLVLDYTGPRYFIIGTNHRAVQRRVLRDMGRLPPLEKEPEDALEGAMGMDGVDEAEAYDEADALDEEERLAAVPCINWGDDDHDESIVITNTYLHGGAALYSSSDSEA
ncbi:hypothetical protein F4780DRAFT_768939 [Xylariomycetidae sp. FL0641]|nr:hypothetical protein F4780DRAFT_768939 [Xylariomycetidae sp. FL0641]